MLDALNKGFEEPQNPDELIDLLRKNRINTAKGRPDPEQKEYCQNINFENDAHLLLPATFQLQEELLSVIDQSSPFNLARSFYLDLKTFIDICREIGEEEAVVNIVKKATDMHLDYFDKCKKGDFKIIQRNIIVSMLVVLEYFNIRFPNNLVINGLQAETEHLLAKHMEWSVEQSYAKGVNPESNPQDLIIKVNSSYEDAMWSAKLAAGLKKQGVIQVEDPAEMEHWEDIATDYANWLIDTGQDEEAKFICKLVELEVPNTNISEIVGFTVKEANTIVYGDGPYVDLSMLAEQTGRDLNDLIIEKYPAFALDKEKSN